MAAWLPSFREGCIIKPGDDDKYSNSTAALSDADLPDGVFTAFGVNSEGKINQYHVRSTFDKKLLKSTKSELKSMVGNPQAVAVLRMRDLKAQPVLKEDGAVCPPPLQRMPDKTRMKYILCDVGNGSTEYFYMSRVGALQYRPPPSPLPIMGKGNVSRATLRKNLASTLLEVMFGQGAVQADEALTQEEYEVAEDFFEGEFGNHTWPLRDDLTAPAQGEGADGLVVDAGQVKSYFNPFDIDVEERNWYMSQIGHKNAREAKALVVHALFQIPMKYKPATLYGLEPFGRGVFKNQEEADAGGAAGAYKRWTTSGLIDAAISGDDDAEYTCAFNGHSLKDNVKYWVIKDCDGEALGDGDNTAFMNSMTGEVPELKPTMIAMNDGTSIPGRLFKAAQGMNKQRDGDGNIVKKASGGGGMIGMRVAGKTKPTSKTAKASVDGDAIEALLDLVVPPDVWDLPPFKKKQSAKKKQKGQTGAEVEPGAQHFQDYEAGIYALLLQKGFTKNAGRKGSGKAPATTGLASAMGMGDDEEYTPLGKLLREDLENDIRKLFKNLQLNDAYEDDEGFD